MIITNIISNLSVLKMTEFVLFLSKSLYIRKMGVTKVKNLAMLTKALEVVAKNKLTGQMYKCCNVSSLRYPKFRPKSALIKFKMASEINGKISAASRVAAT